MRSTRRVFLSAALPWACARGQGSEIESLWIGLGKPLNAKTREAFARVLTEPRFAKVDGLFLLVPPPTFGDFEPGFLAELEALKRRARRPIIATTYPVGAEGWETSHHSRAAEKAGGGFAGGKNMPREKWFERAAALIPGIWGLNIETMARTPTAAELLGYIRAFGSAAHAHGRKAAVWYQANWERFQPTGKIAVPLWSQAAAAVDYVVWMDTKTLLADAGEAGARQRVAEILGLTGGKTVFQIGLWGPEEQAYDEARKFLGLAQAEGVRRFALWANPQRLDSPGFLQFYDELHKAAPARE